ncbi:ABC transporter permease [Nocardioides panacisoli]|uniref:ABC transporter permease n=1 Tax=Nocardioides panacisoli TaxID=627624 RepID=UPI001C63B678|nr:ABC transporter permease [Nocardioides panacisoli]QYJ04195.1 ABC transporter permease [Nocardioides panacisoli]
MNHPTDTTDDLHGTEGIAGTAPAEDPAGERGGEGGLWAVVARREIFAKLSDKSFLIGSVVMLGLIIGLIALQVVLESRTTSHEVAVSDPAAVALVESADALAAERDEDVVLEVREVSGDGARDLVADDDVDGWLHRTGDGSWELVTKDVADRSLEQLLAEVVRESAMAANADAAGTSLDELTAGADLATAQVSGDAAESEFRGLLGFAFAFLFYVASIMFGMTIAQSIVEEKQSRIVEMIAAAVPLRQLLAGKVLGNTALAFGQMVLYVAVAMVGLSFTEYADLVPAFSGEVGWFLVFFVVGFLALACLWAVAGALASRIEDLQSTSAPLTILLVVMFLGSAFLDGRWATLASYVPPVSAIVMPQRLVEGTAAWWEPVAALALLVAAAGALVLVGERIYRRALLQTGGKLSLRQAWRLEG